MGTQSGPLIPYREDLWHFTCPRCRGWWTIGDFPIAPRLGTPGAVVGLFCPHCGRWAAIAAP